jgi:hypothetical protein
MMNDTNLTTVLFLEFHARSLAVSRFTYTVCQKSVRLSELDRAHRPDRIRVV